MENLYFRANHENQVLIDRLKKELEDWKEKSNKLQVQLDELKSQYNKLEKEHNHMKGDYQACKRGVSGCKSEQAALGKRISSLIGKFKIRPLEPVAILAFLYKRKYFTI